jgi:hypothetical protein
MAFAEEPDQGTLHVVRRPPCVKRGHSQRAECVPVLAIVKQAALDDVCGPALTQGAGYAQEKGVAVWRKVIGDGSGK